jgi:S-adenosylmethionine decarboxylase
MIREFKNRTKIKPELSTHFIGTIISQNGNKLLDGYGCLEVVRVIIKEHDAQCLGELMHEFPNKSFTLLLSMAESHISIHTWPERFTVQLDVFLCNYLNDNSKKCKNIYDDIVEYFDPQEINTTALERL